jgi:hypothetical protein
MAHDESSRVAKETQKNTVSFIKKKIHPHDESSRVAKET